MEQNNENHRREKNKTHFKAYYVTFFILCIVLVAGFLIFSNVTFKPEGKIIFEDQYKKVVEFRNGLLKTFDKVKNEVEIKDTLDEKVVTVKLESPQTRILFDDPYIAELDITKFKELLYENRVDFYDKESFSSAVGDKTNDLSLFMKFYDPNQPYEKEVCDSKEVCGKNPDSQNLSEYCYYETVNCRNVTYNGTWKAFNSFDDLTFGSQRIRLYADGVEAGKVYEWIPSFNGIEIEEWADFGLAEKMEYNYDMGDNTLIRNNRAKGMSFEVGWLTDTYSSWTLKGVTLRMKEQNNPTDWLAVRIWNMTSSDSDDLGEIVCQNLTAIDGDDLTGGMVPYNVSFDGLGCPTMDNGTFWWVEVDFDSNGDEGNGAYLDHDNVVNSYGATHGKFLYSEDNFSTVLDHTYSVWFETWGTEAGGGDVAPTITLISPTDYSNTSVDDMVFNCTSTDDNGVLNVSLYIDDSRNKTVLNVSAGENISFYETINDFQDGDYNWTCEACDSASCKLNETTRYFKIDSTAPTLSIAYPTNTTYGTNITTLNYTVADSGIGTDSCWYSKNGGTVNSSKVVAGINFTNTGSVEGSNTYTLYCNDSLGNENSTSVTFFWDTYAPVFTSASIYTLENNDTAGFQVTATDDSGIDTFLDNDTAIFTTNASGYITSNRFLNVGNHYLNVSVNDTLGNLNSSILHINVTNFLDTPVIYDEIDDSSFNTSLWNETEGGVAPNFTITEDTDSFIILGLDKDIGTDGASHYNNVTTSELPDINSIDSIVLYSHLDARYNHGGGYARVGIDTFGYDLITIERNGSVLGSVEDYTLWYLKRNDSLTNNTFEVYDNNTWVAQFNATTSNITLKSGYYDHSNNVQIRTFNKLYYAYYEIGVGSISITHNSPSDTSEQLNPITFNISSIVTDSSLKNITFYIDGVLNETKLISGLSNESIFIKNLSYGTHNWNVKVCKNDSLCKNSSEDSVTGSRVVVNSETYSATTSEGNTEFFELNVTTASLGVNEVNLFYNGTNYSGVITNTGGNNYSLSKSLEIPSIASKTNFSFYWNLIFDDSGVYNTTAKNQTVQVIGVDDCSGFSNLILNYTIRDEEQQSIFNGSFSNTTFEVDIDVYPIGSVIPIIEYSDTIPETNPIQLCMDNNLSGITYSMDVQARYSAEDYSTEYHHIQNYTLNESTIPQNVQLYDLATADAQEFLIIFKDENFLPVENALINIQRKYVDEGVFKSVEIPKTDKDGQTIAHLVLSDVFYTIIVSKNGETLATYENVIAVCDNVATGDCEINLNVFSSTTPIEDFEEYNNIVYSPSFNESSRTVSILYNTADGSTSTMLMNVTKLDRLVILLYVLIH